ncbi:MAG: AAA family ATPase, partial [Alphaproteobacteria bacterium]|nr:AAA family ATPase [Alphaproteobacteria bacterium]
SWHDVAGLDDTKRLMRETLEWSLRHDEKFAANGVRPPCSILLSGGQGTGKTSLVRALASVIPLNFVEISCPVLTTRDADASARTIHDCFALARRKAPCLVFLDDIDVLFESQGASEPVSVPRPVVARLLNELDGLALFPGVVVIASTNRPDRLTMDVLRPGRFDYAVALPMPDHAARKKILEIHARKLPLAADVDFDRLAAATQSMSPAELANLCNRVGLIALRQSLGGEQGGVIPPVVNAALFEQALRGRKG